MPELSKLKVKSNWHWRKRTISQLTHKMVLMLFKHHATLLHDLCLLKALIKWNFCGFEHLLLALYCLFYKLLNCHTVWFCRLYGFSFYYEWNKEAQQQQGVSANDTSAALTVKLFPCKSWWKWLARMILSRLHLYCILMCGRRTEQPLGKWWPILWEL